MSNHAVARRYAQALIEHADEAGKIEAVDTDMRLLRQALTDSRELVGLFASPVIARARKRAVVTSLFEGRVEPVTLRFLQLLVDKKREGLFSEVVETFLTLRDEQLGITDAQVRSALPLNESDRTSITDALEQMTGRQVRLTVEEDASLLGGLVVRVGDTVHDGSLSNRLKRLRERLIHGSLAAQ